MKLVVADDTGLRLSRVRYSRIEDGTVAVATQLIVARK